MSSITFPVMSAFPYFTKNTVQNDDDRRIQGLLYAVKDGRQVTSTANGQTMPAADWFVNAIKLTAADRPFLNNRRTLVPMPSSKVTGVPADRARWVCYDVASRLVAKGYARDARPLLLRTVAVTSSRDARSRGEDPPSVQAHRDSMGVDLQQLAGVEAITLVDDVVSAGRNSCGAVLRLRAAGFQGDIALYSVAYTNYTPGVRAGYVGHILLHEGNPKSVRTADYVGQAPQGPWNAAPPSAAEMAFLTAHGA